MRYGKPRNDRQCNSSGGRTGVLLNLTKMAYYGRMSATTAGRWQENEKEKEPSTSLLSRDNAVAGVPSARRSDDASRGAFVPHIREGLILRQPFAALKTPAAGLDGGGGQEGGATGGKL